jgi:hypothetical protein
MEVATNFSCQKIKNLTSDDFLKNHIWWQNRQIDNRTPFHEFHPSSCGFVFIFGSVVQISLL